MKTNNDYLVVSDISFSYNDKETILDKISFSLNEDDILVILGASGDGKTTLLRIISGSLIENNGDVFIKGISQKKIVAHKRNIAYLFQQVNLYNHLSIYENLMFGFKKQKLSFDEKDIRIKQMLKRLNLVKYVNLKTKYLSLGQQQKTAIGKAFLSNADLFLFDEPFSSLDEVSRQEFLEILKEEKKNNHVPFIYVTHDYEDAYKIATKVLILKKGKILQFGGFKEVINDPHSIDVFNYIGERINKISAYIKNNQIILENIIINSNIKSIYEGNILLAIPLTSFKITKRKQTDSFIGQFIRSYIDKNGNNYVVLNYQNNAIEIPYNTFPLYDINEDVYFEIEIDNYYVFSQKNGNRIY